MDKNTDKYSSIKPIPENGRKSKLSLGKLKTFESFKVPAYRIYFVSNIGQWAAMSMEMMARSLLVYRLTGSGTMIGVLALAQAVPQLLMAFFGGALADRLQKRSILIFSQIMTGLISLLIALSLQTGYLSKENPGSWWIIFLTSISQGIMMGLVSPARMAIITEIVGEKLVMNGISLTSIGQTVFQLAGPILAGFLIDNYEFTSVYYFLTAMYILSTVLTIPLPRTAKAKNKEGSNTFRDVAEGLRYIKRETILTLIVLFAICHMVSGMPYQQLTPIFTEDILKVGAEGLGVMMTVSGIGGGICTIIIASIPNRRRGIILLSSGLFMGVPLIVFSFSHWYGLSLAMMPFLGVGPAIHGALTGTLIQVYTEPEYRGRVQSFAALGSGLASFGTFLVGIMADKIGVQWAVGSMAIFLSGITLVFFIFSPKLRNLE